MKYVGKLFGQIGRTRGYFDLGKTSEDWDALEARAERAEAELASERGRLDYIRAELALLREWQREVIQNANAHHAERKDAIARAESAEREAFDWKKIARYETARAERAEAELAGIRALADRRNERDHSQDTTHQLVAALDQALDIAQAELAKERARLKEMAAELAHCAGYIASVRTDRLITWHEELYALQTLEWAEGAFEIAEKANAVLEAHDAAMKEGAK